MLFLLCFILPNDEIYPPCSFISDGKGVVVNPDGSLSVVVEGTAHASFG